MKNKLAKSKNKKKADKMQKSKTQIKSEKEKSIKEKYTDMMFGLITGQRNIDDIKNEEFLRKKRKTSSKSKKNQKQEEDNISESDYNPLYTLNNVNALSGYMSGDSDDEKVEKEIVKTTKN